MTREACTLSVAARSRFGVLALLALLVTACSQARETRSCAGTDARVGAIRISGADARRGSAEAVWQTAILRDPATRPARLPPGSILADDRPQRVLRSSIRLAVDTGTIKVFVAQDRTGGLCSEVFYEGRTLGAGCGRTGFLGDAIQLDCTRSLVWSLIPDGVRSVELTGHRYALNAVVSANAFAVVAPIDWTAGPVFQARLAFRDGAVGYVESP